MTTPTTWAGRALVVLYGFFGCSGAILFFNLFLERIITLLACVLKAIHERDLRRRGLLDRRDSQLSFDDRLDDWKPSVYWVMLCLFLATAVLSASASALYARAEQWSYSEALYFCFIGFSTIGFGDLVPNQKAAYPNLVITWYRAANFVIMSAGCCCIYSLFNVTSIVIKQFLNWLIRRLDCTCKPRKTKGQKPTRAAARTGTSTKRSAHKGDAVTDSDSDADSMFDSDDERGHTGDLICMSDLLRANKVSLAVMQKQLYETAQRGTPVLLPQRALQENDSFKPGAVGPLAIVSEKFGDRRA
ncbi:unnamed protein product [Ixodes hexagonus]